MRGDYAKSLIFAFTQQNDIVGEHRITAAIQRRGNGRFSRSRWTYERNGGVLRGHGACVQANLDAYP